MLISCTSVATCQIMTAFLLWRVEQLTSASGVSFIRCVLMWLAASALILLGLAESAIDWKSGDKRRKDPPRRDNGNQNNGSKGPPSQEQMTKGDDLYDESSPTDSGPSLPPVLSRVMSLVTEEDEAVGKSCLRVLHMLAAFAVVGLNVASQWAGGDAHTRPVSAGIAAIGCVTFFVFCIMVSSHSHRTTTDQHRQCDQQTIALSCADLNCLSFSVSVWLCCSNG